jgi:cytidine deaminase
LNRENKKKSFEKGYYKTHACNETFTCKVCGRLVMPEQTTEITAQTAYPVFLLMMSRETAKVLTANYDSRHFKHTVDCAVRAKSGKIYCGVNVYSLHGACAEQVAIDASITAGEQKFISIVAVRGENGDEILPPCGNCRQMLCDYVPDCQVILQTETGIQKTTARELLSYACSVQDEAKKN